MPVPSVITDLTISEATNNPPDTETVTSATRPSKYLRALGSILRRPFAQGATVASLTAANLGSNTDGDYFHISGTTGIAASNFGTVAAGIVRTIVFDGALLLTYNATSFILPGAANITTAAGDVAVFRSEGAGNWKCTSYVKASGDSVVTGQPINATLTAISSGNISAAWPVGSVFIGVVATNPATLLGGGTWAAFGAGRVMVGFDTSQTEFDTVEKIGGAKTHTLSTAEMPAHVHSISAIANLNATGSVQGAGTANQATTVAATDPTGGGGAHNNLQPYIVCYFWKRTA